MKPTNSKFSGIKSESPCDSLTLKKGVKKNKCKNNRKFQTEVKKINFDDQGKCKAIQVREKCLQKTLSIKLGTKYLLPFLIKNEN